MDASAFNASAIRTVVACGLTTNLSRSKAPGNVLLRNREGNLPKRSVVNISQIVTLNKIDLVERIGSLSGARLREVLSGLDLLTKPRDPPRVMGPR